MYSTFCILWYFELCIKMQPEIKFFTFTAFLICCVDFFFFFNKAFLKCFLGCFFFAADVRVCMYIPKSMPPNSGCPMLHKFSFINPGNLFCKSFLNFHWFILLLKGSMIFMFPSSCGVLTMNSNSQPGFLEELLPLHLSIFRSPGNFFSFEESLAITWKSFSCNLVLILL